MSVVNQVVETRQESCSKMAVEKARRRLETSLSSDALINKENVYRMVSSQLASSFSAPSVSSSSSSASSTSSASLRTVNNNNEGNHFHEIVQNRSEHIWNLLELLRSASGEENHKLAIMAEDDVSSEGWKLKHDTGQLRVMYHEGPKGTPFHTLLAEGLIYSPITSALCLAWEAPSYNLWWPQMTVPSFKITECRWLKRGFNGEDLSLIRVKVPWPLAAREVIMCTFELEVFDEELIIVLLHSFPETEESDKSSEIPGALPNVVRMELAGGFALQKVSPEQSYFRTVANLDIKLDFVPPWLINFISRQLIGLGFKLYQKTLASINKGEGCSKHFQELIETEPMYERIRKGLQLRKVKDAVLTKETSCKRLHGDEESSTSKSSKLNEEVENFGTVEISSLEEMVPVVPVDGRLTECKPTIVPGRPSCDASASVDPEVQKALNVLDQMISLVQSRKLGGSVVDENVSMPAKSVDSCRTSTHSVGTQDTVMLNTGQDLALSMVAPIEQAVDKIEGHSSIETSQIKAKRKWFCLPPSICCCGCK